MAFILGEGWAIEIVTAKDLLALTLFCFGI